MPNRRRCPADSFPQYSGVMIIGPGIMPLAGPIVMFPPPAVVLTVAEYEALGVAAAVAVATPEAPGPAGDSAAAAEDDAVGEALAVDEPGAASDREASAVDS